MSAKTSPKAWDLRCEVREKMLVWLQAEHEGALPRKRAELKGDGYQTRASGHDGARVDGAMTGH